MTLELSTKASLLSQKTNLEPQLIVVIDDIPLIFGALDVEKLIRYGMDDPEVFFGDLGIVYGGTIVRDDSRAWVMLDGTTTKIKQQIDPDKEGSTSIQKLSIKLVDKDQELSKIFAPNEIVEDVLSKQGEVFITFKGGSYPEDAIRILSGIVTSLDWGAGFCKLTISHPEYLKRTDLFELKSRTLDGAISSGDTTITLDNAEDFLLSQDVFTTYVRIDDEIIKYAGISGNQLTGCTRGQLNTVANPHDDKSDVETFYALSGGPLDLALKLMLSNQDSPYYAEEGAVNFRQIDGSTVVENGIYFNDTRLQSRLGFVVGDFITVSGASEAANNFTDRTITNVVGSNDGTIITVDGAALVDEIDSSGIASFKSKYNVLPEGAKLDPRTVDVAYHEKWDTLFPTSFPDYLFYLKDTINAKDFINKEIYFPAGLFPVPRDGRASVQFSIPPLVDADSRFVDSRNIKKPESLVIKRSTSSNFYNAVVYRYNEDSIDDKFLAAVVTQSARSTNRIKTVNKPLRIESKGLRDDGNTFNIINRQTRRFLDRYQFGAQTIVAEVMFGGVQGGFAIEVGDIVLFGDEDLQITDISRGDRKFETRLMEVINKELDLKTGMVRLHLIDSSFGIDGRFGTFSPTSQIGSNATTTRLPLLKGFGTPDNREENFKWQQYIGQTITINNADYSIEEEVTLIGFDATNINTMIIDPALSFTPDSTHFVNMPKYQETDPESSTNFLWKTSHCFATVEVPVVSGTSGTQFDISGADVGKFFEGAIIRVHTLDFTTDSSPDETVDDAIVTDITGTTLTVSRDLGFTPDNTMVVNLVGFIDEGKPYRFV